MATKNMIMLFYAATTAVLIFLGYNYANKIVEVSANIGALLGGLLGITISIALWYTVGKKMVKKD